MIRRERLFPDKDKKPKLKPTRYSFTDLSTLVDKHNGKQQAPPETSPQPEGPQRSLSFGHSPRARLKRLPESFPRDSKAYELKSICGQGATAKVYRACCVPLQEVCAVKMVDLESVGQNLDTIIHEAQLMCDLRHPNVLSMLACFVEGRYLWMVLPFIPGGSVESAMNYAFPKGLEERVIAPLMMQVLKALEYLHKRGIVHRDVKASNVLLERDNAVLGDFGIAANMERRLDSCSKSEFGRYLSRTTFVGTPVWMAPEVIEQECGHGLKADIYSFGMTLLELAIGKAPFAGMPFEVVAMNKLHHASPTLPATYEGRQFSPDMQEVVAQCLDKDPNKRPTAAALLKHRFFKWTRTPQAAIEELLLGVPGPVQRLTSLTRRSRESGQNHEEEFNPFAADERVSLATLKSKDAQAATQRFDADSALVLLHRMLQSSGLFFTSSAGSPESASSTLSKSNSNTPRKASFTKRKNSFASGNHWPNLPPTALRHCAGMLFASAGRKGFGLQTTWGHGCVMARKTCDSGMSCWSGPCYVYISGNMHLGVGENVRESIILYSGRTPMEKLTSEGVFKMSALKFVDAVEENLDAAAICDKLRSSPPQCHGVAFRHYTGTKSWKVHGVVHVDAAANERVYGRSVSAADILNWRAKPPNSFSPLIEVLISCEEGKYDRASSDGDSSEASVHGLRPLSSLPLPAETKRNLKALKSVPISFNSLGLDTAFSGSFNGIGDSPAANAAGSDSAISAVPEHTAVCGNNGSADCSSMLRPSSSAPLHHHDLPPIEGLKVGAKQAEDFSHLSPPPSLFAGSGEEAVAGRSTHNDSALDLSSLDSAAALERTSRENLDAASSKTREVDDSQLVEGQANEAGVREPYIARIITGGAAISPFAILGATVEGGSPGAGFQRALDLEPSRSTASAKSVRSDSTWRPPRPPMRSPSASPKEVLPSKCPRHSS